MKQIKTPEQLAEDHAFNIFAERYESLDSEERHVYAEAVDAFLAGYQAAKEQLADVDKVMNSSNNSNGWISVKERLPEIEQYVVIYDRGQFSTSYLTVWEHWAIKQQDILPQPTHWMLLPKLPEEE